MDITTELSAWVGGAMSVYGVFLFTCFLSAYGVNKYIVGRKRMKSRHRRFTVWFRHDPIDQNGRKKLRGS